MSSETGVLEHSAGQQRQHDDDPDAGWQQHPALIRAGCSQQIVQPRDRCFDTLFISQSLGGAANNKHHPQRDDEWHQLETRDQQTGDAAAKHSCRDSRERGGQWRDAGSKQQRDDDRAQRYNGPNRKVDSGRGDNDGHPQRGHRHDRGLSRDEFEVAGSKELQSDNESKHQTHEEQPKNRSRSVQPPGQRPFLPLQFPGCRFQLNRPVHPAVPPAVASSIS